MSDPSKTVWLVHARDYSYDEIRVYSTFDAAIASCTAGEVYGLQLDTNEIATWSEWVVDICKKTGAELRMYRKDDCTSYSGTSRRYAVYSALLIQGRSLDSADDAREAALVEREAYLAWCAQIGREP